MWLFRRELLEDLVLTDLGADLLIREERVEIRDQELLSNQARMVETFSGIVLGGEDALDPQWPRISLMTQQVVDALQISWQEEGRKITL